MTDATDQDDPVTDIVCGMVKPKSQMPFQSHFNGKVFYFCARQDKELFDAYPDRWSQANTDSKPRES